MGDKRIFDMGHHRSASVAKSRCACVFVSAKKFDYLGMLAEERLLVFSIYNSTDSEYEINQYGTRTLKTVEFLSWKTRIDGTMNSGVGKQDGARD